MIDNAAWVWASFAFNRSFSARNRSVSRSARDRRAVVAELFLDPFADPAGAAVSRARVHSCTWEWNSPSRRGTADFSPCGAASYSATTFALYSAVKLRRTGRGAGLTGPDPFGSGVCLLLLTYASPVTPYKPTPIAGVSHDILTGRDPGRRQDAVVIPDVGREHRRGSKGLDNP
jgi:hypothetical protein